MPRIRGIDTSGDAIGAIKHFGTTTLPFGYIACDGTSYSTTGAYAALFSIVQYSFGGSGANFNVPDLRGRTVIGTGTGGGLSARTLADVLGEEDHVLSTGELATHSHGISDGGHAHGISDGGHAHVNVSYEWFVYFEGAQNGLTGNTAVGGVGTPQTSFVTNTSVTGITGTVGAATGVTAQNTGSNAGHNNMQPSLVCQFAISFI